MPKTKVTTNTSTMVKVAVGVLFGAGIVAFGFGFALSGRLNMPDPTRGSPTGGSVVGAPGKKVPVPSPASTVPVATPVITQMPIPGNPNNQVYNGDMDLYRFQVSVKPGANGANTIAWKQIMFNLGKSPSMTISNFRLRRGNMEMNPSEYAIVNSDMMNIDVGADLMNGAIASSTPQVYFLVVMKPGFEAMETGSGNVYTIHANVAFNPAKLNNPIIGIALDRSSSTKIHGSLNSWSINPNLVQLQFVPGVSAWDMRSFIWSDVSAVPHGACVEGSGCTSSKDWWNAAYVTDLPYPGPNFSGLMTN
ncbi:hypothetical protein KBC54_00590 [Patescibacteria group bacterium]|nr:hypothetical protein [Patescibacteria group bacterium]